MKGTDLEHQNNRKCIDLSLIESSTAEKYENENSMQRLKTENKMA